MFWFMYSPVSFLKNNFIGFVPFWLIIKFCVVVPLVKFAHPVVL